MKNLNVVLSFCLLFSLHNSFSQNKAVVETSKLCNCNLNLSMLDSLMDVFGKMYKGDFLSTTYSMDKKLEDIFKEKANFFNKQLAINTFNKNCCSKYSSIYAMMILAEDTLNLNCTVFEYSFNDYKDILEIKKAFERYHSNHFISQMQYYYKYYIFRNNVSIVSTSSTAQYKVEHSLYNQFCKFMSSVTSR